MPALQQRNSELVDLLTPDFQGRNEPQFALQRLIAASLSIPGLRGLWTPSHRDEAGSNFDLSGQGRTLTMVSNVPTGVYNNITPYMNYDGGADLSFRNSEAGLNITGLETTTDASIRGLTIINWVQPVVMPGAGAADAIMSKYNPAGNNLQYLSYVDGTSSAAAFAVSGNGIAAVFVTGPSPLSTGAWFHVACRYVPSTETAIWVNGVKGTPQLVGVPASLFAGTYRFEVAAFAAANTFNMLWGGGLIAAAALPPAMIVAHYEASRAAFGR